jgi:hypothetical protein
VICWQNTFPIQEEDKLMPRLRASIMLLMVMVIGAWPAQARQTGVVEGNNSWVVS